MKKMTVEEIAAHLASLAKEVTLPVIEKIIKKADSKEAVSRIGKELCYFESFSVDLILFTTGLLDRALMQRLRTAYKDKWVSITETAFSIDEDEYYERMMSYGASAQKGMEGANLRFGFLFSEFCFDDKDIEVSMLVGLMFQGIFEAVTKYITSVREELKIV